MYEVIAKFVPFSDAHLVVIFALACTIMATKNTWFFSNFAKVIVVFISSSWLGIVALRVLEWLPVIPQ